jgi:hypothetical protein
MDEKIRNQILKIRDTGLTNMFHVQNVRKIADFMGFKELLNFLKNHKDKYAKFILTGEI